MVSFSQFQQLHPEARRLTLDLFEGSDSDDPFYGFSLLWMSFNGWMSAVAGPAPDAHMINNLAANPRLMTAFIDLANESARFRDRVEEFASWWPIFDSQTARKYLHRSLYEVHDREDFYQLAFPDERIRRRPRDWAHGNAPRWGDLLQAIYQVRCNLFHGTKSPVNWGDSALVGMSHQTLRMFVARSGLYDWDDIDA
ncbi:MAG TPA: hypothetical protein VF574_08985 [Allosphingosinicella sp.]|jgi:hypothetical protein